MFRRTSIQSTLNFREKIMSIDYILVLSVLTLGIISMFTMYSTDGGVFDYHTKNHIIRFFLFFLIVFVFLLLLFFFVLLVLLIILLIFWVFIYPSCLFFLLPYVFIMLWVAGGIWSLKVIPASAITANRQKKVTLPYLKFIETD